MKRFLIFFIKIYQVFIKPFLDLLILIVFGTKSSCKFHPSCSQNMVNKIKEKGSFAGIKEGLKQVSRCYFINS